jgi:photosystem II stability/assembly factor-like uncharacterized protein
MSTIRPIARHLLIIRLALFVATVATGHAQTDEQLDRALHWRNIGPHRGGRTRAVAGVPSKPNLFYMAQVNGGVFRSTDYGRTWDPIFDDQPTGSIGALAVSLSNPEIIYAGSGEGLHRPDLSVGDGIYKSTNGGTSWEHLGLRDGQQIAQIAIDPTNPDRVFVAVSGHPYGPNEERGIFRSTDGGKTFEKVLSKDENTGGADVQINPAHPEIVYASLWESREGPWENAKWDGDNGGIFKSIDGGKTWKQLGGGLPVPMVQANISIAPSAPDHLFAAVGTRKGGALYRSDNGGETWTIATTDRRPANGIGGGDLPVVRFDPRDPKTVYSASVVCWKSIDGGKTWSGFRGAPGGDDYQNVWINPNNSDIILLGSDQGAIVTVNGGKTWSSWYNQSTAQMFHVTADNDFPYRLCGGQQESGSVCISSRGDDGAVTFRDWHPVAAEEYGYVAADPLDPDTVYGGKLTRYNRRTGQAVDILPKAFRSADFRMIRTQPVVFSPVDLHLLFFAANTLWKTSNGGDNWEQISPDLTRTSSEIPASVGKYRAQATAGPTPKGVIYTVAPSPLDVKRIWAGTDDGLIHLTIDGGQNWSDVTPPAISAWQKISLMDAGHFDPGTAYAAVNTLRLDQLHPHIFRTHDGGKTWQEIVRGIPDGETVNVVREDPQRKGLLFAGTERAVYMSTDDGENWRSLRLNLPATSVRDLIVKGDDLAVATHGRGFWILDNVTPLRQWNPGTREDFLFKPQEAMRVRFSMNTDTPLPPDEPAGQNPPDGAMIDYYLASGTGEVSLEIKDAKGNLVRRYASSDVAPPPDPRLNIPSYWVRPFQTLANQAGLHRFLWDLHYTPLAGIELEYPMTAVYARTAPAATSPWAMPGEYSVTLIANGQSHTQPLTVKMDPRVDATSEELAEQFQALRKLSGLRPDLEKLSRKLDPLMIEIRKAQERANDSPTAKPLEALAKKLHDLAGTGIARPGTPLELDVLPKTQGLFSNVERADAAPTASTLSAINEIAEKAKSVAEEWKTIESQDLPALNQQLEAAGLAKIQIHD